MAEQVQTDQDPDWRVRLHLSESDNVSYLYKAPYPGILEPLKKTNGIIFPYTPTIQVQYNASYKNYDLTHSNYRGYFYTGSAVQNVMITATLTANDNSEALYLLATMHFLRTCTKMFYGQDYQRGMPPPLVFLTGYGEYQFKNHPCLISMFSYNLPNDVDYIPAEAPITPSKPTSMFQSASQNRLGSTTLGYGGDYKPGVLKNEVPGVSSLGLSPNSELPDIRVYDGKTYVPTRITLNFQMLPINTRAQIADDFSLEDYANGKLIKKGFW